MSNDIKIRMEKATKVFKVYRREVPSENKRWKMGGRIKGSHLFAVKNVNLSVTRGKLF